MPAELFVDWRLFSEPFDIKVDHCIHSTVPKQAKRVGACEFLIMFIIAGVWIFQVSSNSQWGNGRNRMMMGWMYKFTLFFMPYSNSHVLKVHGTYYCTFCAMCLVTESKQTPFICIIHSMYTSYPHVDLYLISEKSIWKNQVQRTWFLIYFKLVFYCLCSLQKLILKLIFVGSTGNKNQVRNRLKIKFVELDFSKLIFQKSSTDQQVSLG